MMYIRELFVTAEESLVLARPESDPLREQDSLQEAQVVEFRLDATSQIAGVIFDLRQALQLREANTGVLMARGLVDFRWISHRRDGALTAWSVESSRPRLEHGGVLLNLGMGPQPGASLLVQAERATFYLGNSQGLSETPPNYMGADRRSLGAEIPGWDSRIELVRASDLVGGLS